MLSEISQEVKVKYHFTYMWNLINKINKVETDSWIYRTD